MRSIKILLWAYCVICMLACVYIIVPDRLNLVRSVGKNVIYQAVINSPSLEETVDQRFDVPKHSAFQQEMVFNQAPSHDQMQSHTTKLQNIDGTKIPDTDTKAMLERERLYLKFLDTARTVDELLKDKPKTKRLPDVINIGAEKCGTGFLLEILNKHPKFRFPNESEMHFFSYKWTLGVDYYRKKMPESSPYHFVMEKSPSYFNFFSEMVPQRMYSTVPNVKIVVLLCDPVNRTWSDFVHQQVAMGTIPKEANFSSYMPHIIDSNKEILSYMDSDKNAIEFIFRSLRKNINNHLISTALYYYHMIRWLGWFPREQIYVIDGEDLIRDPGKVTEELQDYLGIPKLVIKEDFERGPGGFYCIHELKVEERMGIRRVVKGDLDCMDKSLKGRTRFGGTPYKPSEEILSELRDFFRPSNEKLYRLLGRRFSWD